MEIQSPTQVAESQLLEETFNFWYQGDKHIRSPFPEYIRTQLKENATKAFIAWLENIPSSAQKEINDEIVAEKLEEVIFENAVPLVKTEDEKITISYPFLPRLGDTILKKDNEEDEGEEHKITDRALVKEGDNKFLQVKTVSVETNEEWDTRFELIG